LAYKKAGSKYIGINNKRILQRPGIKFHRKGISTHTHPKSVKKHLGFPKKVSVLRKGQLEVPFHMLTTNTFIEYVVSYEYPGESSINQRINNTIRSQKDDCVNRCRAREEFLLKFSFKLQS
jgi:hypothetical protein